MSFASGSIYAGPSFMYMNFSEKEYSNPIAPYLDREVSTDAIAIGAIIGGQYRIGDRFSCFLDLGADYTIENTSTKNYDNTGSTIAEKEEKERTLLFRAATIGLCFYLN